MEILCFYAGIAFVFTKSFYAPLFVLLGLFFKPKIMFIYGFSVGMLLAWGHALWVADYHMPKAQVIPKATLKGQIVSLPNVTEGKIQFQFQISELNARKVRAIVLLSCYQHCLHYVSGQWWVFNAKLKQPQALGNPGAFDYRGLLASKHIHWTGYLNGRQHQLKDFFGDNKLLRLRQRLAEKIEKQLPNKQTLGVFLALTLGISNAISKTQWDLFRHTGTIHLIDISGAHIGLITALSIKVVKWLWTRSTKLCLYTPAIRPASFISLGIAFIYTLLSGFSVPAQRAFLACFCLLLKYCLPFRLTVWQSWRYGFFIVLLIEPHVVLWPGFYLAFLAVASLLIIHQRFPEKGFKKKIYLQLACLFGLMPLTLYWFSYSSINGLLANLLAIPLVDFFIVPLGLFILLILPWIQVDIFFWLIDKSIKLMLWWMELIDMLAIANITIALPHFSSVVILFLALAIFLFFPLKILQIPAIILCFVSFYPHYSQISQGVAKIDVIDVGQGLAVLVRTKNHTLLYDTGMKFYQGSDMGKLAIIPYLTYLGISKIDKLIISHPDLDHRGGLESIEEKLLVKQLLVDNPNFYHRGINCHQFSPWTWDQVQFSFLSTNSVFHDKNNSSCVLKISTPKAAILLPGDIEKAAENFLVQRYPEALGADILVLAHHGSKTSTTMPFVQTVKPKFALISAGFDNRFHFPHSKTLATLAAQGIPMFSTISCGMISIILRAAQKSELFCFKENKAINF